MGEQWNLLGSCELPALGVNESVPAGSKTFSLSKPLEAGGTGKIILEKYEKGDWIRCLTVDGGSITDARIADFKKRGEASARPAASTPF
ncbi:MAG: hypothetical protein KBT02_08180 [Treponema sp.]|nr:hypothetical protein [Candidatus Treponema caballi]